MAEDSISNVRLLVADITDFPALKAASAETAKITGENLDILINNAAYIASSWKKVHEYTPEQFTTELTASIQANVIGVSHTINAFLPLLRKGSKVITLSTGIADMDLVNEFEIDMGVTYSISKAATNMLIVKYNAALGKKEGILFFSIGRQGAAERGGSGGVCQDGCGVS